MGTKKSAADLTSDLKKKRKVGFSSIDAGVEANDCIKIFLVAKKKLMLKKAVVLTRLILTRFFGEDGKVYGYKDLKINIWLSSISFHAYADITFESTSDGGKGITDLKSALQSIFGESLLESKDDFLQTFSKETQYISDFSSNGKVVQFKNPRDHQNGASSVEVIHLPVTSIAVRELYGRLVPLVLLLVDGSSPIDISDPKWEIYLMVQKTDQKGDSSSKLLGFATVYRFYQYPDSFRLRISQMLILPPYQGQGHDLHLSEVLKSAENVHDMAIGEPSDHLQQVRTRSVGVAGSFTVTLAIVDGLVSAADTRNFLGLKMIMEPQGNGESEVEKRIKKVLMVSDYCYMASCGDSTIPLRVCKKMTKKLKRSVAPLPGQMVANLFKSEMDRQAAKLEKENPGWILESDIIIGLIEGDSSKIFRIKLKQPVIERVMCGYSFNGCSSPDVPIYLKNNYRPLMSKEEAMLVAQACVDLSAGNAIKVANARVAKGEDADPLVGGWVDGCSLQHGKPFAWTDLGPVAPIELMKCNPFGRFVPVYP
ncbi:hypothetical protein MKX03_009784 [Papaver bracteatum]|nr:hypothetical protein MKX03_009784 [Papaver bracteatum]